MPTPPPIRRNIKLDYKNVSKQFKLYDEPYNCVAIALILYAFKRDGKEVIKYPGLPAYTITHADLICLLTDNAEYNTVLSRYITWETYTIKSYII